MEMREDLMKEQPPHDSDGTSNEVNGEETGTGLLPISTGTKAAFSKSHDAVRAAATSG
jgi:hypothetical protein